MLLKFLLCALLMSISLAASSKKCDLGEYDFATGKCISIAKIKGVIKDFVFFNGELSALIQTESNNGLVLRYRDSFRIGDDITISLKKKIK